MMFKVGDKVTIKAEFLNPGETVQVFEVITDPNVMGRVQIVAVESALKIRPVELVDAYMLEAVA